MPEETEDIELENLIHARDTKEAKDSHKAFSRIPEGSLCKLFGLFLAVGLLCLLSFRAGLNETTTEVVADAAEASSKIEGSQKNSSAQRTIQPSASLPSSPDKSLQPVPVPVPHLKPTIAGSRARKHSSLKSAKDEEGSSDEEDSDKRVDKRWDKENGGCQGNVRATRHGKCEATWPKGKSDMESSVHQGLFKAMTQTKFFVQFFGYARSGHSLIGSLIDAHPNATISNEFDVLKVAKKNLCWPKLDESDVEKQKFKKFLFEGILRNSFSCGKHRVQAGYSYHVPGMYQGNWDQGIEVIGDKKGSSSTRFLRGSNLEERFHSKYEPFKRAIGVPFRYMHVIRCPYDMVATYTMRAVLRKDYEKRHKDPGVVLSSGHERKLMKTARFYASMIQTNLALRRIVAKDPNDKWLDLYSEDFIANPQEGVRRFAKFLDLEAFPEYVKATSSIVMSSQSKTCLKVRWSKEACRTLKTVINEDPVMREKYFVNRQCCKDFND